MLRKPITISGWHKGLGPSSAFGFQELRGLNITDEPGYVKPNMATQEDSDSNIAGKIQGWCEDDSGTIYGHDGNGQKIYFRSDYQDWNVVTGLNAADIHDIFFFKGYIGYVQGDDIGWINPALGVNGYVTTWSSVLSQTKNKSVLAQDDVLYLISHVSIDKLEEDTTFDPTDTNTYTITQNVVSFSANIGTVVNAFEIGDFIYTITTKSIFPYWAIADETKFETPLYTNKPVQQAIQFNKRMYLQMGYKGEWYRTDGTTFTRVAKLPVSLFGEGTVIYTYQGCVHNDLIYFGVGGSSAYTPQGVYSFDPEFDETEIKMSRINLEYIVETNEDGSTNGIQFGPLFSLGESVDQLLIPYYTGTTFQIDSISEGQYTGDKSYFISALYRINGGTDGSENTIDNIDVFLARPLVSGDSFKFYYRENLSTGLTAGWTQIGSTWSYDADENNFYKQFSFSKAPKNIQLKGVLNGTIVLIEVVMQ